MVQAIGSSKGKTSRESTWKRSPWNANNHSQSTHIHFFTHFLSSSCSQLTSQSSNKPTAFPFCLWESSFQLSGFQQNGLDLSSSVSCKLARSFINFYSQWCVRVKMYIVKWYVHVQNYITISVSAVYICYLYIHVISGYIIKLNQFHTRVNIMSRNMYPYFMLLVCIHMHNSDVQRHCHS